MNTTDSEGPAWNKFWLSLEHDSESVVSDGTSHQRSLRPHSTEPGYARQSSHFDHSVLPTDSASHVGDSPPGSLLSPHDPRIHHNPEDIPFPFKFKAPSGRVHRVQVVASQGLMVVLGAIVEKLGPEIEQVGGEPEFSGDGKLESQGVALSYIDNDGDVVSITSDQDLLDAITIARQIGKDKVDLFVHHPDVPPQPVEPVRMETPKSERRRKKRVEESEEDDDYESEEERPRRRKGRSAAAAPVPEQLVPGVPNELLLPGAIGVLAVVIITVFTLSRSSSKY